MILSGLSFSPNTFEIGSRETIPLAFNMAALLAVGESVASPVSALWDLTLGSSYGSGLSGSPTAAGDVITQTVTALVSGHTYRLMVGMTPVAGKTLYGDVILSCPEGWS